jgi:integrase
VRDFDAFGPSLFLAADNSKDRKPHRQPIPKDLAEKLRSLTEGREADEPLLGIPKGGACASDWISGDYDKAKVALETPEGRATWHSLRKCFVNALVRSGQDLKTVMTLARHSTAQLSMEVYASADPTLLRQGAQAASEYIEKAISEAQCCTRVARKAAQGGGEPVTVNTNNGLEVSELERVAGIEPA